MALTLAYHALLAAWARPSLRVLFECHQLAAERSLIWRHDMLGDSNMGDYARFQQLAAQRIFLAFHARRRDITVI